MKDRIEHVLSLVVDAAGRIPQDTGWDLLQLARVELEKLALEAERIVTRLTELEAQLAAATAPSDPPPAP